MMTQTIFMPEQTDCIDKARIPKHVAFIPDGNRRWAKNRFTLPFKGHQVGADTLIRVAKASQELGIKTVTFYVFSTENWNRSGQEVAALMWLLENFLKTRLSDMLDCGARLRVIGNIEALRPSAIKLIQEVTAATAHCDKINLVLAVNYGGRDDIRRAVENIAEDVSQGKLSKDQISESLISKYLDTAEWEDPDLLIRTSGESRISNFLLWQLSYAEIYVTPVFWPDFTSTHLLEAIVDFQKRQRRLGGK
jgi:undecaprenyl diphosphate synthase